MGFLPDLLLSLQKDIRTYQLFVKVEKSGSP